VQVLVLDEATAAVNLGAGRHQKRVSAQFCSICVQVLVLDEAAATF
jgi:hypothetical protein